jgi:hypothetical protein
VNSLNGTAVIPPPVPATRPPAPRTLEEFYAWRQAREERIKARANAWRDWSAEHGKTMPGWSNGPVQTPEMQAWLAEDQEMRDREISASLADDGSGPVFAYWNQVQLKEYLRTARFYTCPEQKDALTWGRLWNTGIPDAVGVAAKILEPLATMEYRIAFDPDARRWLKFDPEKGVFHTEPGTAEQYARVLVAEAAARSKAAYDKISEYADIFWSLPEATRLPVHAGEHWGYSTFWQIASGKWYREDDYGPSPDQVAQALVNLVCSREYADNARKGIRAGESGRGMFLPWQRADYYDGWECGDYEGVYDFGGDPLLTSMEYQEVPFRAAGYLPDPDCPHPGFDQLLELIFPDPAVRLAWLRSTAMCFTGSPTKEVLFWRGETGRGKSLLAALMSNLLGGYARNVPAKLLFGYAADDQRAAQELVGTWMAVVEEGVGNQSFKANEAFKAMSNGGALLNARKLYHESRTVESTHTLVLCANAEADPDFKDDAILERLVPISFIGHKDQIREYGLRYTPPGQADTLWKREAPGVLAMMLGYAQEFLDGWRPKTLLDLKKAGMLDATVDYDLALEGSRALLSVHKVVLRRQLRAAGPR